MIPSDNPLLRKNELEDVLDKYGRRSRTFGVLVVVGLTIEFVAIALSFFHEAISRIVDGCGLFLVTAGVGGEIRAEFNSHRAERRLRAVNKELSQMADEKVRERDERIERLRKQNNGMAIFLGDRRIIDPIEFQQAMSVFAGTTFMIFANKDRESKGFALALRHNLVEAGWILNQFGDNAEHEGVQIVEHGFTERSCSDAAEALADALNFNHVATITSRSGAGAPWATGIYVGIKPETLEMQARIQEEREAQKKRRSEEQPDTGRGPLSPRR
jgi:hypothetical protein